MLAKVGRSGNKTSAQKGAFPFCDVLFSGKLFTMQDSSRVRLSWENAPETLTVKEAAALLRVTPSAVYAAIKLGLLPAANFGKRQTRIAKDILREELAKKGELNGLTAAFGRVPEA
jgi:excisionase family DNA binding protein